MIWETVAVTETLDCDQMTVDSMEITNATDETEARARAED